MLCLVRERSKSNLKSLFFFSFSAVLNIRSRSLNEFQEIYFWSHFCELRKKRRIDWAGCMVCRIIYLCTNEKKRKFQVKWYLEEAGNHCVIPEYWKLQLFRWWKFEFPILKKPFNARKKRRKKNPFKQIMGWTLSFSGDNILCVKKTKKRS